MAISASHCVTCMLELLIKATKKAGERLESMYEQSYDQYHGIEFPVTEADKASHNVIIEVLSEVEIPILSEESLDDLSRYSSDQVIIIDPLDGTRDYIAKTGEFCVMAALIKDKAPVAGAIYEPTTKILYFAEKGSGAYMVHNDVKTQMRVSDSSDASEMICYESRFHKSSIPGDLVRAMGMKELVSMGSLLKCMKIAQGIGHVTFNTARKTGEWDTAAPAIILEEAGGSMTDLYGEPLVFNKEAPYNTRGFIASSGTLHSEIVEAMQTIPGALDDSE